MLRPQHDESGSPRTPKSRFDIIEKTSSVSPEDSATNLAEVFLMFFSLKDFSNFSF